jgi:hypothetical protein
VSYQDLAYELLEAIEKIVPTENHKDYEIIGFAQYALAHPKHLGEMPPFDSQWRDITDLSAYIHNTGKHAFFGCIKADFYTPENDAHIMGTAYEKDGRYYLMVWGGDDVEFSPTHWCPLPASPVTATTAPAQPDLAQIREQALEEAAKLIEDGFSKDVGTPWREDGQPSKHDKCPHGNWHYEDCEQCAVKAIRALKARSTTQEGG